VSSTNQLAELLETLEAAADRKRFNRREFFEPYPKQPSSSRWARPSANVSSWPATSSESRGGRGRSLLPHDGQVPGRGGRASGSTKPTRGWIAGQTGLLVRDVQQKKLCGPPGVVSEQGTGFIPRADFIDKTLARGVTDAYDTIQVQHYGPDGKKDGISTATFKSYEQGRAKFQGEPVDWIWCDEEPPADVYSEIVTRTNATKGIVFMTFTPLLGMSDVVMRFLNEETADPRCRHHDDRRRHALHPGGACSGRGRLPAARTGGPRQGHPHAGLGTHLPVQRGEHS
jgi:phage terminase large subunit-like protein